MDTAQLDLEIAKLVVTTLVTLVAAAFALKISASQRDIAKRQADTAREARDVSAAKLNLDLFEARYAVFLEVWKFLTIATGTSSEDAPMTELVNLVPKAQFLFGKDIADYMQNMIARRVDLIVAQRKDKKHSLDPEAIEHMIAWFFAEADNCHERFAPYLDFSGWQTQHWAKNASR